MSGHTNGKLEVKKSPFEVYNRGHGQLKNQLVIGYTLVAALYDDKINDPNPRRLAAAWNACEGIPTEALEAGVVKDMLGALKMVGAIIHNGDDPDGSGFFDITSAQIEQVFAAIARATGEKP